MQEKEELPKNLIEWKEEHVKQFFESSPVLKKYVEKFTNWDGVLLSVLPKETFVESMGILEGNACFALLAQYKGLLFFFFSFFVNYLE
jgi:ATP/ADP translocase